MASFFSDKLASPRGASCPLFSPGSHFFLSTACFALPLAALTGSSGLPVRFCMTFASSSTMSSSTSSLRIAWDSQALNGTSHSTRDFIRVLEQLTLHDNLRFLTMLPWAEVLSCRYLIRRLKAWCPFCYQEWLEEGMPIYDPLLWALEVAIFSTHPLLISSMPASQ